MFYFVVPFRSAQTTKNWPLTCHLLGRTLRNLAAQRSPNWRIVLVCHERPEIVELNFPNVIVQPVEIPVPNEFDDRKADKHRKYAIGVEAVFDIASAESNVSLMFVDADDLLSVRLVEFIELTEPTNGFLISRGYLHTPNSRICWKHDRFSTLCGSSAIFNLRQGPQRVFKNPKELVDIIHGKRSGWRAAMADRGTPFSDYPLRGAVYSLSTGDNHSDNSLGFRWKPWRMAWIGKRMQEEFPGLREPV